MTNINILTNNSAPNSRAFNTPLFIARPFLEKQQIQLHFHWKVTEKLFNADVLFINSNFFRTYWKTSKSDIFHTLEAAAKSKQKIIWFDTTDSTWCTQFEVLPFVDLFLKSHLLKDKKLYLKNFRTGRIFTDFFDDLYKSGEKKENYPPLPEKELYKLGLSWAPCFEKYDENRYSIKRKIANCIRPFTCQFVTEKLKVDFFPIDSPREKKYSARFGLTHSRPSVVDHRKAIASLLQKRGCECSRIPLPDYFKEMRQAQISLSPFGVGEFCYRDYEAIICGSTLLKPDMSHLETWPDLYQENKTYIPHKWDLADLDEKLDYLLNNQDCSIEIAKKAQKVYKKALSSEGMEEFAERLVKIVMP